jgi:hypothetical protein
MRLSVVIASQSSSATALVECVRSFDEQRGDLIGQIIVATSGDHHLSDQLQEACPSVEIVHRPGQALVPELWAAGVAHSREGVVALSTAEMRAEPGWAAAMLARYGRESWAAVGGPILPAQHLTPLDTAIYWLRYHRFARLDPAHAVSDIAGDNASYRREALSPHFDTIVCNGFWENELNRDLVAAGAQLCLDPTAKVSYAGGESFAVFARQRLAHGRRFGIERFRYASVLRRVLLLAIWPATPLALVARILRAAVTSTSPMHLATALPPLCALVACWSAGELLGYLAAAIGGNRRRAVADPVHTA